MKKCSKCRVNKPLNDFNKNRSTRDGRQAYCRPCSVRAAGEWNAQNRTSNPEANRRYHLAKHGLTVEEFNELGKACQICGDAVKLHVDHDHRDGLVRGLLCTHCNRGLGAFRDRPDLLQVAISYLEQPPLAHLGRTSKL